MNSDVGAVRCSGRCATAARAEDEDQPGFDEPGCLQCKQRGVEAGLGQGTGRGGHRGGGCRRGAARVASRAGISVPLLAPAALALALPLPAAAGAAAATTTTTAAQPASTAVGAKPSIVLVHGAFADASGWSAEVRYLTRRKYPVIYGHEGGYQLEPEPLLFAIDMDEITLVR